MSKQPNRNDEEEEVTLQETAGMIDQFEHLLGDIGRGGDFPMTRARAAWGPSTAAPTEPALPARPRGITLEQPSPPPAFPLPPVPRLPVRTRSQTPATASSRPELPLPRSPLGAVEPIVASDAETKPGPEATGSPGEAASTDRQEIVQINPHTRRPGMYSLFPTKSNRFAVTMMASSTASPSQGNALSSSPSLGSQPTENLAPPGRPSLEERSLSAASVASAAPSSASVSAGEESLPRPADHLEPNNPYGYPAPPAFRHNWANPNRRAARGCVLGGAVSGVVVGSRPRPSLSGGVLAVPYLPFSLPPVLPGPVSPPALTRPAPTRPAPPALPSRPPPAVPSSPAIPARNPARLGPASPAPSGSARDDKKTHGVKKEEK